MLKVLVTVDYEIHGNGDGSPVDLMVEPTDRLMGLLDRYGAKLTIMADAAEILRFKTHFEATGKDTFGYRRIEDQLRNAVLRGHDVQLHLHPSYFNATLADGRWQQDWSEYDFASLPLDRMVQMVQIGKSFLEELLRPSCPEYECIAFRAANWSVSPSHNVAEALVKNRIRIDTSVFKHGKRDGIVNFDYAHAHHPLIPWPASEEDMSRKDPRSSLFEFPIYSELRTSWVFLTWPRLKRALSSNRHRVSDNVPLRDVRKLPKRTRTETIAGWIRMATSRHAWKADMNQCTERQLIHALYRAERLCGGMQACVPFVMIGHSKLFDHANARRMEKFLRHIRDRSPRFGFGLFRDFNQAAFA